MLIDMRFAFCALLALSACYAPAVVGGAPCDPSRDSCPTGQTCQAVGSGNFCMGPGGNGGVDAAPTSVDDCFGNKLLGRVCLEHVPSKPVTFATQTINTASVGVGSCDEIRAQPGGPSLCLVTATTITVSAGTTLRATGPNPLVLIATQSITINGGIDVASHAGDPAVGAGARTAMGAVPGCSVTSLDGVAGVKNNNNFNGGGGAAGGGFGGAGGAGGTGGKGNTARGNPAALGAAPTVLVGGCPGGRGGDGIGGGGALGGGGGGAVYLLAGDSITVPGKINASGAGGAGGTSGADSSGGGGGGGSGGMIGLEATHITVTGSLVSNGGGGGGGAGGDLGLVGQAGSDPASVAAAAGGPGGDQGGGSGGLGGSGAQAGSVGSPGSNFNECAGGGGGGGAGVIRVFGVSPSSLTGMVSPPAT
jgi:hypothetical protein